MKRFLLVLPVIILVSAFVTEAQIVFSKEYGGQYNEEGRWMEQLPDSGFIMTGMTETYSNGQADIWLVRADAYGNTLWTKSIGGTQWDYGNMVKRTRDNGYIIAGFTNSYGAGNNDGWLIKTDGNGNVLWNKLFGDAGDQQLNAVIQSADGGYVAVGLSNGNATQYYDILLVKVDSAGHQLWSRNIGGGAYERGNAVQQTADGGFIITGQTYSYGHFDGDFYLVKTNASGIVQWQKTYGYAGIEEAHYVQITPDGGYALVGDADSLPNSFGNTDMWFVRTNSSGDTLWTRNYGAAQKDGGKTVENTHDGGFILAGITRVFDVNNPNNPNFYLVKTDSAGFVEWSNSSYGSNFHDHAYRALQTSDGGFAEFGFFRNSASYQNFSLVKLGPDGGVTKDLAVDNFIDPQQIICRSNQVPIAVTLTNYGTQNELNIPVSVDITNASGTTTLHDTLMGSLLPSTSALLTFHHTFNFTAIGTYTLTSYIQHRSSDISYSNDTNIISVNVLAATGDPVTTSGVSCAPAAVTLRAVGASPADSLFWYDSPAGGNLISAGTSFVTPVLNADTTYYVEAVKGKGDFTGAASNAIGTYASSNNGYLKFECSKPFKLISVKVYATSAGPRIIELRDAAGTVLQSSTVTLPIGQSRVCLNFDVPRGVDLQLGLGTGSGDLVRNNSGVVFPYEVPNTLKINNSSSGPGYYYYFYDWYIFVPYENCASNRIPVSALIGTPPVAVFDRARCGTGTVLLTANSPAALQWYSAPSGGRLLGSGSSYTTPSLSTTTTYYLQVGSCSGRIPVQAVIHPVSAAPVTAGATRCGPGTLTLTATASDSIFWYDAGANGNLMGTGNAFLTPYLIVSTTYYAVAGSTCPSPAVPVLAAVNSAAPPTVIGASACGPSAVILTAVSSDSVAWFDVAAGGTALDTTYSFLTPVLAQTATYYAQALSACVSVRIPVHALITTVDPPVPANASICGPGQVVISALAIDSVSWWSDTTGGTRLGTGINFTTPALATSTTYFAQASRGGCTSARVPVVAEIIITPPPVATPGRHCGPGSVTLQAASSDSITWYDAPAGGNLLGTGSTFTTPVLNSTFTYYAEAGLNCPSIRTAVDAIIDSTAADPAVTGNSRCGSGSVDLQASSLDSVSWYDSPGGILLGAGLLFGTPSISTTTTYYAVAGIPGCVSHAVPVVAQVNPMPADPLVSDTASCGPAQMLLHAVSPDSLTWYDAFVGGNVMGTGADYQSYFTSTTTLYVQSFNGWCSSNRVPAIASVWLPPSINIGPDTLSIFSGQSITLDAGAGFASYQWSNHATTQLIQVSTAGNFRVVVTDSHHCQARDSIQINIITGMQQPNDLVDFEIYPNPSQGQIEIQFDNTGSPADIRITDVPGNIIFSDCMAGTARYRRMIDLSEVSKGMYFIRIDERGKISTRRFIIN